MSDDTQQQSYATQMLRRVQASAAAHGHTPTNLATGLAKPDKTKHGDPVLIGQVYADLAQSVGWQPALSTARLSALWPQIVGQVAAQHSYVVEYQPDLIKIGATSDNWAVQLRLLEPTIKDKIAQVTGLGTVGNIVILPPRTAGTIRRRQGR